MCRTVIVLVLLGLCFHTAAALPGSGSQQDPWRIESLADFDEFAADPNYWSGFTRLETNLNLAGRTYSTAVIASLTGVFDGNDHKIIGLTINGGVGKDYLGLFGSIKEDGQVSNLGLEGGSVSGGWFVGGLVGYNTGGSVSKCYSTGSVSGIVRVGGLLGWNNGGVSNCYSTSSVSGYGYVGGLVGLIWGKGSVSNCYSTGDISGDRYVGGLVGGNDGSVSNCYSTGSVTGSDYVGGLIGKGRGAINCFWDIETSSQTTSAGGTGKTTAKMKTATTYLWWNGCGKIIWTIDEGIDYPRLLWEGRPGQPLPQHQLQDFVQGSGTETEPYLISTAEELNMIGLFPCEWDKYFMLTADVNLIDYNDSSYNIIGDSGAPFTGVFDGNDHKIIGLTINGGDNDYLGLFGCVGEDSQVRNLGLEGGSISGDDYVGGLVGYNSGNVSNCYSTGDVSGGIYVGGLVGLNRGDISDCYSTVDVNGYVDVGGLVGGNWGSVSNCYSTGDVNGTGWGVGGLVGYNNHEGYVSNCYSTGSVSGDDDVGGLVGYNHGRLSNCYSTGSVSGEDWVGGMVGHNGYTGWTLEPGYISNSYSTGSVEGASDVGGLVGSNGGSISNCYSTGDVNGAEYVGGLVGSNLGRIWVGSISNCYSTGDINGVKNVGGLVGQNGFVEEWFVFSGYIFNCYSTGSVQGTSNVGGLVGYHFVGDIEGSFWDIQTSGEPNMCGYQDEDATGCDPNCGKTTAEMKTKSTFTEVGWDFVEIWLINQWATYPVLRQEIRSDLNGDSGVDFIDFAIFADHWLEGKGN